MVEEQLIEANPCLAIPRKAKPKQRVRDYTPSSSKRSEPYGPWPKADPEANVCDLTRLLILAPLRLREMTGLRWREVDLVNGWLRIPASRMKARLAHDMPLSDEARAVPTASCGRYASRPRRPRLPIAQQQADQYLGAQSPGRIVQGAEPDARNRTRRSDTTRGSL